MLTGTWLSSNHWGIEYSLDFFNVGINLLLINNDFSQPTIDFINWTPAVEIKFYIVCAIHITHIRQAHTTALLMTSTLILAYREWIPPSPDSIQVLGGRYFFNTQPQMATNTD